MIGVLWLPLLLSAQVPISKAQGECLKSDALKEAGKVMLQKGRWLPENLERLNRLLKSSGASSSSYDPCRRPLAVFDFDNTAIAGDIGDETFASAVEDSFFKADQTFFGLMPESHREEIQKLWPTEAGAPVSPRLRYLVHDSYHQICREKGTQTCYAWLVQLFAGKTPEELETYASKVIERALASAQHEERLPSGDDNPPVVLQRNVILRPEIKDLMQALVANGFDVFIVTASAEWIVRAFAPRFGLAPDRVVGLRTVIGKSGALTDQILPPITYRAGKVVAIRNRIAPGGRVPVFAAGDTLTDWEMLDESHGESLLFDRDVPQLKAHAQARGYMIQPVFEAP